MKQGKFAINELVWAKYEEYEWWPGVLGKEKTKDNYEVYFCGEDNKGVISLENIKKWAEYFRRFTAKVDNDALFFAIGIALKLQERIFDFKDHVDYIQKANKEEIVKETMEYLSFESALGHDDYEKYSKEKRTKDKGKNNNNNTKDKNQEKIDKIIVKRKKEIIDEKSTELLGKKREREVEEIAKKNIKQQQEKKKEVKKEVDISKQLLEMKKSCEIINQFKDNYSKGKNKKKLISHLPHMKENLNTFNTLLEKIDDYTKPLNPLLGTQHSNLNRLESYDNMTQIIDIIKSKNTIDTQKQLYIPLYLTCRALAEIFHQFGKITLSYESFYSNCIKPNFFNVLLSKEKKKLKTHKHQSNRDSIAKLINQSLKTQIDSNSIESLSPLLDILSVYIETIAAIKDISLKKVYKDIIKRTIDTIDKRYQLTASYEIVYNLNPFNFNN